MLTERHVREGGDDLIFCHVAGEQVVCVVRRGCLKGCARRECGGMMAKL
jgi:hypothetical protein